MFSNTDFSCIHFHYGWSSVGCGETGANPSWRRVRYTLDRDHQTITGIMQRWTTIHTHTYQQFRESNSANLHVFGLQEETHTGVRTIRKPHTESPQLTRDWAQILLWSHSAHQCTTMIFYLLMCACWWLPITCKVLSLYMPHAAHYHFFIPSKFPKRLND